MKGHFYKRGKTWTCVIDIGTDAQTGKRRQKTKGGFATKKEAQAAAAKIITELTEGSYTEPSKIELGAFMDTWLDGKRMNLKESSYMMYEMFIRAYITPKLGKVKLENLRPVQIQKLYNEMSETYNPTTVNKVHRLLKSALDQAVRFGYLKRNPAENTEKPKASKASIQVWDEEQVKRFLETAKKSRYHIAFLLAVTTGMRKGEILGLRWQDIDFEQKTLSIQQTLSMQHKLIQTTKTAGSQRSIHLDDKTIEALKSHRLRIMKEKLQAGPAYTDQDLVCCGLTGGTANIQSFWRCFRDISDEAELPRIRFHDLRHTHATLMLKAGIHPKVVSERLGHTDIGITLNTYSHVIKGMQEEAAEKIGEMLFG